MPSSFIIVKSMTYWPSEPSCIEDGGSLCQHFIEVEVLRHTSIGLLVVIINLHESECCHVDGRYIYFL